MEGRQILHLSIEARITFPDLVQCLHYPPCTVRPGLLLISMRAQPVTVTIPKPKA